MKIQFQYYNKIDCKRCASTNKAIALTLKELKAVSKDMKFDFKERKLPRSKIYLSPSICIDGEDIESILDKNSKLKSNICLDCCQLVRGNVKCRTFNYKGRNYDYIPKKMIIDAINISLKKGNSKAE